MARVRFGGIREAVGANTGGIGKVSGEGVDVVSGCI